MLTLNLRCFEEQPAIGTHISVRQDYQQQLTNKRASGIDFVGAHSFLN